MRLFDHMDLRVSSLEKVRPFYSNLLSALGFHHDATIPEWLQFEAVGEDGAAGAFFGITESSSHIPNENRIAFWADSVDKVDHLAEVAKNAGALNMEGPGWEDDARAYYAVFFEDPDRNRLEICYRSRPVQA